MPCLPRISNHTDFDALRAHPDVDLRFVATAQDAGGADLVILPGSKNTRGDLAWLEANGWRPFLKRHLRYGGKVIGICGGFQMLGESVGDPHGVEGAPGVSAGLGFLPMHTEIALEKQLAQVAGHCTFAEAAVTGYEIHMGVSSGPALAAPAFVIDGRAEGARSADDQILGSYLHGMFDAAPACAALLAWAGLQTEKSVDAKALREQSLDLIAETVRPLVNQLRSRFA